MLLALSGCGGAGSGAGSVQGQGNFAADAAAARFLMRATFGPTRGDIAHLRAIGYAQWFEEQGNAPPSLTRPALSSLAAKGVTLNQQHRLDKWWEHAIVGPDQLRQRMAWALSQIMVVSETSDPLAAEPLVMSEFYDVLAVNALGNYRQLLDQVTLNPAMGVYLSALQNQKGNPAFNLRPDENYAREVLQLFSIGTVELNQDGTEVLDPNGNPVPTYDQSVVEGFAATFTGWTWANVLGFWQNLPSWLPMEMWEGYHEPQSKQLLSGAVLPAGQGGVADMAAGLDNIAGHPNVGPFLGKQLIGHFVTSNPSPQYVARVAAVWNDDGTGERGDLLAVLQAILTDPEALGGHASDPVRFGKVKEPMLRLTALWRAFDARSANGLYRLQASEDILGQAALRAPSVFSFFSPFYSPPGELQDNGLRAPELQLITHSLVTTMTNELFARATWFYSGNPAISPSQVAINTSAIDHLASDIPALLRELDVLLVGGLLPAESEQIIRAHLTGPALKASGLSVVREAIYMVATSPEAAVQR